MTTTRENAAPAATTTSGQVYVGCAGWALSSGVLARFPGHGTQLTKYAGVFPAVEINTCFYRPHRPSTYARWSESVPESFRFAAKVPKAITHEMRLRNAGAALEKFIAEAGRLEGKLGCLLVQLPPRMRYDGAAAQQFFPALQSLTDAHIVFEPRHPSWFAPEAAELLFGMKVAYVHADPSTAPVPEPPGGSTLEYIRLHGSPEMYHSPYPETYLDCLAAEIAYKAHAGKEVWCVFDNTASGAAVPNALSLLERLRGTIPVAVLA